MPSNDSAGTNSLLPAPSCTQTSVSWVAAPVVELHSALRLMQPSLVHAQTAAGCRCRMLGRAHSPAYTRRIEPRTSSTSGSTSTAALCTSATKPSRCTLLCCCRYSTTSHGCKSDTVTLLVLAPSTMEVHGRALEYPADVCRTGRWCCPVQLRCAGQICAQAGLCCA